MQEGIAPDHFPYGLDSDASLGNMRMFIMRYPCRNDVSIRAKEVR